MTVSYHERSNAAPALLRWARGFAVACFIVSVSGCSVSMPMSGLIDGSPSGDVAGKAANDPSPDSSAEKPAVEVAAAQP